MSGLPPEVVGPFADLARWVADEHTTLFELTVAAERLVTHSGGRGSQVLLKQDDSTWQVSAVGGPATDGFCWLRAVGDSRESAMRALIGALAEEIEPNAPILSKVIRQAKAEAKRAWT